MNYFAFLFGSEARMAKTLVYAAALQGCLGVAVATDTSYMMSNGNSSANVNYAVGNEQGLYNWTVDGVNQMNQQSFWFQIGGGGPAANIGSNPQSVSTITTANSLELTYVYPQFNFDVLYTLKGATAGSGNSSLAEQISIDNTSGSELDFYLFQYTDINLLNNPGGDSVTLTGGPSFSVAQTQGDVAYANTVGTPGVASVEAAPFGTLLNLLNGSSFPVLNGNTTLANTDVTYALEWGLTIPSSGYGSSQIINESLSLHAVPEPSAWSLALMGLCALVAFRRRVFDCASGN